MKEVPNHTGCPVQPLEKFRPHPMNPILHPPGQINLLANILEYQGWRNPIVVSELSGYIVAGHGRLAAAIQLGLDVAPISSQKFTDEAQEIAHMLADNRIAELAIKNLNNLKDLVLHIDTGAFNMDLTGFTEEDLSTLFMPPKEPEPEPQPKEIKSEETCQQCCRRVHFLD